MIAVVALVVVGPEKLPEVARTTGRWVGRLRRYFNTIKDDIDREIRLQELQESIKQNEGKAIYEFLEETKSNVDTLKQDVSAAIPLEQKNESKPSNAN